jgi:Rhodopirellula transposase DDE domain
VNQRNPAADAADGGWRLSLEANATGNIGPGARGGPHRGPGHAADHALAPAATGTPVGICLPTLGALGVDGVMAKVTRAGRVERLAQWWAAVRERCAPLTTLGRNLAHGPAPHSQRTPWMPRRGACGPPSHRPVRLAYSPPSPSKSKPIERCWGILPHQGHGTLRDSLDTVRRLPRPMTGNGTHPVVALVTATSQPGVTWTQHAMETVEAQRQQLPALGKWFVDIVAHPLLLRDT